jgi:chromosome segregation protein
VHLKWLDIAGFKSFPDKTRLQFEPGMTAIVGPNGCGKSNVSDAIRWVLGETSARALRGAKMEDCIFNGTDARKPLGMAEVNITFTDCESVLGTEFNEVTVTRRVLRSGEGQYFLNKTPCRLKDIQRLFMNTGIGTSSYSLMEQGRIDQILSSRPEDRREIFEEASGITKFKMDKREASRKLEQTEANLLRLADVIREVKRQIGSLQRQAGKARRFKELREELRRLDLCFSRDRLSRMDADLQQLETELRTIAEESAGLHTELQNLEAGEAEQRARLTATEEAIGQAMEHRAAAQTRLDRSTDTVRINRDRIRELETLADRDRRDISEAEAQIEKHRRDLDALVSSVDEARQRREQSEKEWQSRHAALQALEQEIEARRTQLQQFRNDSLEQENAVARLQNEQVQLEARDRANMLRRERLIAEKSQLSHSLQGYEERQATIIETLRALAREIEHGTALFNELNRQRVSQADESRETQKNLATLQSQIAARHAQIDLLQKAEIEAEDFPGGARLLLDKTHPPTVAANQILGPLAQHLDVAPEFRVALEAALRAWLDAVIIRDSAQAAVLLQFLAERRQGAARLVALDPAAPAPEADPAGPGSPLADQVRCSDEVRPLIRRLLAGVRIVDSFPDGAAPLPAQAVWVTRDGAILRGDGAFEFWMREPGQSNPLARHHLIADLKQDLTQIEDQVRLKSDTLKALQEAGANLENAIETARSDSEDRRRTLAVRENENQMVSQEANQARDRLETVVWELHQLDEQGDGSAERQGVADRIDAAREAQSALRGQIDALSREIQSLDQRRSALYTEVGELRVRFAEARQQVEHLESRREPLKARILELETLVKGRAGGIVSYRTSIDQLTRSAAEAETQIEPLQAELATAAAGLDTLRKQRETQNTELGDIGARLGTKRERLEELAGRRTEREVLFAEGRMRRQNLVDRLAGDYNANLEELHAAPDPEWPEGRPDPETLERMVEECRGRIEAMGPVNLVAIEEYQELEERHSFLTQQQDDLTAAKQQLVEMIKKINVTTSEMFLSTFAQVNENFQAMFTKLFNGGTARLVLADEGDVLESGIDIIARPPGKKLQTVSLLSGGERTMTAVALLFSIYQIKPSPFCVLDELDAALDESNIARFVSILESFLNQSQFVVITHNRRTIGAANTLYGVTMEERGISKVMSMKFSDYESNSKLQTNSKI